MPVLWLRWEWQSGAQQVSGEYKEAQPGDLPGGRVPWVDYGKMNRNHFNLFISRWERKKELDKASGVWTYIHFLVWGESYMDWNIFLFHGVSAFGFISPSQHRKIRRVGEDCKAHHCRDGSRAPHSKWLHRGDSGILRKTCCCCFFHSRWQVRGQGSLAVMTPPALYMFGERVRQLCGVGTNAHRAPGQSAWERWRRQDGCHRVIRRAPLGYVLYPRNPHLFVNHPLPTSFGKCIFLGNLLAWKILLFPLPECKSFLCIPG